MKLYAIYSSSHNELVEDWFLPSLEDDFELKLVQSPIQGEGSFLSEDWFENLILRVEMTLRAIEENPDIPFVYSDVDIQFFGPIKKLLEDLIRDQDVVFQRHISTGGICSGFFICRGNERTKRLWSHVLSQLETRRNQWHDQNIINLLLLKNPYPHRKVSWWQQVRYNAYHRKHESIAQSLRWSLLPNRFATGLGMTRGRAWRRELPLDIPPGILLHHANGAPDIPSKLEFMKEVRQHWQSHEGILPQTETDGTPSPHPPNAADDLSSHRF